MRDPVRGVSAPNLGVCSRPNSIASALHVQLDTLNINLSFGLLDPGRIKPHPTSAEAPLGSCLIALMLP